MSYPVPPNSLVKVADASEVARRRLQERDAWLKREWKRDRIDPGRGPSPW